MKIEYISQTILRRTILKPLKKTREEVLFLFSEAERCSAIQLKEKEKAVFATTSVYGNAKEIGIYAIAKVINELATRGAETIGVSIQIMLPPYAYESRLKSMIEYMETLCEQLRIQITCAEADVNPALSMAVVTATAMGQTQDGRLWKINKVQPEQDIVLVGYVGLEGMLRVLSEKEEELRKRFVGTFIHQIKETQKELFALDAMRIAREQNITAMQQIGKGGIMATLWEVAEVCKHGLSVDLKAIPLKQETIEVCEFYHLNPYQMTSTGAILMYTDDGKKLVQAMQDKGIHAAQIGRTTSKKERVLIRGNETRFMERPQPDDLRKIWSE